MRLAEDLPGALWGAVRGLPLSRLPVTRLRGVVALADAVNFGGCPVEVDADVLGLEGTRLYCFAPSSPQLLVCSRPTMITASPR